MAKVDFSFEILIPTTATTTTTTTKNFPSKKKVYSTTYKSEKPTWGFATVKDVTILYKSQTETADKKNSMM